MQGFTNLQLVKKKKKKEAISVKHNKMRYVCTCETHPEIRSQAHDLHSVGKAWSVEDRRNSVVH